VALTLLLGDEAARSELKAFFGAAPDATPARAGGPAGGEKESFPPTAYLNLRAANSLESVGILPVEKKIWGLWITPLPQMKCLTSGVDFCLV
jgi:hypothetical protein